MKGTKVYSVLKNKCPRCQEGDFFIQPNPFKLKGFSRMNEKCPKCGEDFEREPGFYYGAMYVSYALNVALGIAFYIITGVILNLNPLHVFLPGYPILVLILFPLTYRQARLTWINFFVHFKKAEKNSSGAN